MNSQEFTQKALRTESKPEKIKFGPVSMHVALSAAIESSEIIEMVKKRAFYGKPIDIAKFRGHAIKALELFELLNNLAGDGVLNLEDDRDLFDGLPNGLDAITPENVNIRILHGVLGMNGESGELLKAVRESLEGKPLDLVNVAEETGDSDWYKAIIHDESGVSEEVSRAKVIAKLEKRYPDKMFDADHANNRDLEAERTVLETA